MPNTDTQTFVTGKLRDALLLNETDLDGVAERFMNNTDLYMACLEEFIKDPSMEQTNLAVAEKHWDEAFTAAHGLKGVAANMGFIPLFHAIGELVILIRGGRLDEVDDCLKLANKKYDDIIYVIQTNLE